ERIPGVPAAPIDQIAKAASDLAAGIGRPDPAAQLPAERERGLLGVEPAGSELKTSDRSDRSRAQAQVEDRSGIAAVFRGKAAGEDIQRLDDLGDQELTGAALEGARKVEAVDVDPGRGVLAAR